MRSLVVYESIFGSTRLIADAIGQGLSATGTVAVGEVGEVGPGRVAAVDLLVVGAPQRAYGLSRDEARMLGALDPMGTGPVGTRDWFGGLTHVGEPAHGGRTVLGVAFGTCAAGACRSGSAAAVTQRRLCRLGFTQPVDEECFRLAGITGPLCEGEVDRARQWGRDLAACLAAVG